MDIVYEMKEVTALQVLERLPSPPSYSAVRALLRVLEQKGHLVHRQDGPRYVYTPRLPRTRPARAPSATSRERSLTARRRASWRPSRHLGGPSRKRIRRLTELIEKARTEGR